jgi:hypothetical protein
MPKLPISAFVFSLLTGAANFVWAASSFEEHANSLQGLWFAPNAEDGNAAVLNITNIKRTDAKSADIVAYYGNANGAWREPGDLIVRAAGTNLSIEFSTPSGSRVRLAPEASGELRGTLLPATNSSTPLAFVRTNLAFVHNWIAENPVSKAKAGKDSIVELVYVSASNCVYCRGWEAEHKESNGKLKSSLGWNEVRFTEIKLGSFRGAVGSRDFPDYARASFDGWLKSRGRTGISGVPWYVVLVNNEVRCAAYGYAFESLIKPAINAALREKTISAERQQR